jgi:hypothetical protein
MAGDRVVGNLDPRVLHAGHVDDELAQILDRDRAARKDRRRREQAGIGVAPPARQQIGQLVLAPVAEISQRIAQLLEDRDARIVDVEVGPRGAGHPLQGAEAFLP